MASEMKPLVQKNAAAKPTAGGSAKTAGFTRLTAVIQEKSRQSAARNGAANGHAKGCEPRVEVVEEDGVVKRIKVTCSCGEVIELDCDYGEG